MPAMIFQASIFRTFQQIFAERNQPQYKELVKFAIYVVRQFVKVAERNKKVFMELLFWKNSKEAFDTEQGYGSYENKSKAMKAAWTEQQEDELKVFVMEYREKQIEEDAVDWLMNNLIDNTKTRRMIIKKLKDLMLMDYKGPKKSGSGNASTRVPQEWGDEEIVQLTELYNQFKEATDPVGCIVDRLDVKRAKNRVKQKIVELGLAPDSKALRKKRAANSKSGQGHGGKARSGNPFVNHSSDEELESDSSSDESSKENNKSLHNNVASTSKRTSASHVSRKKANKPSTQLNLSAASKSIVQLINLDMTESLKWLSECLTEAAEDQMQDIDLDDTEGIPLVAISESDVVAMDHSVFKKFLLSIGIKKPASEQEMYWRIPGYMKADELLKIANVINETIEKGEVILDEPATVDAESSDEDVFDRLRKLVAKPTETENNSTNIETNVDSSQETVEDQRAKLKKKNVIEDSDSEPDNESNKQMNTQTSSIQSSQESNRGNHSQSSNSQSSQKSSQNSNSQSLNSPNSPKSSQIINSQRSNIQSSQESNKESISQYSSSQVSRITNSDDENSDKTDDDDDDEPIATPQKKKKTRIITNEIDSEESDAENSSTAKRAHRSDSETETNASDSKSTKATKILDESEDEASNDDTSSKRTRDSGSESEHVVKRKRVIIDSDDE